MKNLYLEFEAGSTDFLKVLSEMSQNADGNRPVITQLKTYQEQVATIELFYDMARNIFLQYEKELIQEKLVGYYEHAKAVILDKEMKNTYNELFLVRDQIPETFLKLLKNTAIPTKEEMTENINLKHGKETGPST